MKLSRPSVVLPVIFVLATPCCTQSGEVARWEREASRVTITRDDWGIAHVVGESDADAVFGMIYAQAEDDFNRIEANYLFSIGRAAEAEGESAIWRDLRMKLFIDPDSMRAMYARSPDWLRPLMDAWADGLNYYLHTHPDVHPRVITHFEPWMALTFSEGSIGGDIERVDVDDLAAFYGDSGSGPTRRARGDGLPEEPGGSNGIAIAPANTADHHALLLINPHTSFYFRSELQMTSQEGLNAYGAVTWGQFFIYQGFNARAGWMHTSSGVDNIDEYLETVTRTGTGWVYRYGDQELPVRTRMITVPFRTDSGMATRVFTAYYTRHGPIVRREGNRWVSVALMQDPMHALMQSYGRTKARGLTEFRRWMDLHTNSSNNTVFADADGNIAYLHSNFIPRRDTSFDWTRPVDGSNPATDWHGVLSIDESPNAINPSTGWVYNSNNWPWSAAGEASPVRANYPTYVERGVYETARGHHAVRLLADHHDFTMGSFEAAAYDSWLPAFTTMVPALLRAWEALPRSDARRAALAGPIATLRDWDCRWDTTSVATAVAVLWGRDLFRRISRDATDAGMAPEAYAAARTPSGTLLEALSSAVRLLEQDFGTWRTPWGAVNRFQRLNDSIEPQFDDDGPSIPVGFTSSRWGSLAAFNIPRGQTTRHLFGNSGNSFVAVVEFGDSVRAVAVTAGGESGDPASPHFNDQAERYATGNLRPVYFYPAQLEGHTERVYHPGR